MAWTALVGNTKRRRGNTIKVPAGKLRCSSCTGKGKLFPPGGGPESRCRECRGKGWN